MICWHRWHDAIPAERDQNRFPVNCSPDASRYKIGLFSLCDSRDLPYPCRNRKRMTH
jgi:hypothetical protein